MFYCLSKHLSSDKHIAKLFPIINYVLICISILAALPNLARSL